MSDHSSKTAVLSAIAANSFLTVAKFAGAVLSGSGSMFGEAIHTLADLMNQILLYVGLTRAERPPTPEHPYGFAAESFIWALISAVGIFFLGCGVTVYHGIHALLHPGPIELSYVALGTLGLSFVTDGVVLMICYRGLRKAAGDKPFFHYVNTEADPTSVAVLLEDSVATLGVLVALAGLGLSLATGNPIYDALGTLVIGLMLGGVAVFLVAKNRSFLVGKSAPPEALALFEKILRSHPGVLEVRAIKSEIEGIDLFRFKADVNLDGKVLARQLAPWVEGEAGRVAGKAELLRFTEDYAVKLLAAHNVEINSLEAKVREAIPQARYVDLESD